MPQLKRLSSKDVLKIFFELGFTVASQEGSHIKLRRVLKNTKQTLTIPNHKELDKGTIRAIYNQALRYLREEELHEFFSGL